MGGYLQASLSPCQFVSLASLVCFFLFSVRLRPGFIFLRLRCFSSLAWFSALVLFLCSLVVVCYSRVHFYWSPYASCTVRFASWHIAFYCLRGIFFSGLVLGLPPLFSF